MSTLKTWAILLLAVVVLAGCGVRSAYNNLDWLLMRWVNGQVSLTAEQDLSVRQALDDQLLWHCQSQLPLYVEFLESVAADVSAGKLDAERFEVHGERLAAFGRVLMEHTRPDIIELLASLNDDQLEELRESFEERNEEMREQALDLDESERIDNQARSMERGMRRFVGRLTGEQRQRLQQWAGSLEPLAEQTLENRQRWQASFFTALELRADQAAFEPAMSALLQPGADWPDDYRASMMDNREQTLQALADIHAMAPDRQIRRLENRLSGWARDFDRLSCS